jgi:hypothetical protein
MNTQYIGIFKNKQIISKEKLEDLNAIPYVEYIFRKELHHEYPGSNGYICKYPIFIPINKDGTKRIIKIGKFEIIDIGPDEGERNFKGRTIKISESKGKLIHTFRSIELSGRFIESELIPLMETLDKTKSWDIFLKLERLKLLEQENERLKENIEKHQDKILELEEKLSANH